jgi:Lon protease-like protein
LAEHPMVAALGMLDGARTQQSLANQLGYLLPFLNGDKLRLLCLDDPRERLDNIQTLLDELQGELFD